MSRQPPPSPIPELDRPSAWACLMTNLMVLPGLGSVTARQKVGYAQMALALAGVLTTLLFLYQCISHYGEWNQEELELDQLWPVLRTGAIGIGLFLAGWCWSLVTSLQLVHEARR